MAERDWLPEPTETRPLDSLGNVLQLKRIGFAGHETTALFGELLAAF
jgi:hypothetical protein